MEISDFMPDNQEQHLPFLHKDEVFALFVIEIKFLQPTIAPPSKFYFFAVWKGVA